MDRDLSHPVDEGTTVFPGDPPVSLTPHATVAADGYSVTAVACGSHTGTHVDAPSHTAGDGRDIDAFAVDRFAFDAVLVDCTDLAQRSAIGPEAVPATDADAVVFHTGWDAHWGEERYFDHPYLTPEAAVVCAERGYDVAVDALNVDPTPTERAGDDEPEGFQAHHALLGAGRLIVENLTNLAGLPDRFELLAFPLKLAGCDGAPVRAVARY